MPLRDHFRPPVNAKSSWEGFHAMWPAEIVRGLRGLLPPNYVAEPRVRLGTMIEVDPAALETGGGGSFQGHADGGPGAAGIPAWSRERPVVAVETEPREEFVGWALPTVRAEEDGGHCPPYD